MIELIIISAFMGLAFQSYIKPDMIFASWGKMLKMLNKNPIGKKIAKPLGACIICNTFWIGGFVGLIMKHTIPEIFIIGIAASGVAIIINVFVEFLKEKMD